MEKVLEIYIRTTPKRLWEAITDPELRSKYSFGMRVRSDWTPGSRYEASHPRATGLLAGGENLEVDPPIHAPRMIQRKAVGDASASVVPDYEEPIEAEPAPSPPPCRAPSPVWSRAGGRQW